MVQSSTAHALRKRSLQIGCIHTRIYHQDVDCIEKTHVIWIPVRLRPPYNVEATLFCLLSLLLVGSSSRGDMLSCSVLVSEICGSRSGVFGSGRLPVCIINWVAFFHDPLSIHPGEIRLETVWEPLVNLFPAGAPPAARQFQASLLFSLPLPNWTGSCMFFNSNRILGWLAQYEQHLSFSYDSAFLFVCKSYSRIWNIDKRLLFWQTFFFSASSVRIHQTLPPSSHPM